MNEYQPLLSPIFLDDLLMSVAFRLRTLVEDEGYERNWIFQRYKETENKAFDIGLFREGKHELMD